MMNGGGPGEGRSKEPVERVMDLFVHTPIGLAVMAWKRVPGFVGSMPEMVGQALAKGCAQLAEAEGRLAEEVRKARMIGQVAVTFGGRQVRREVDARLAEVRRTAEGMAGFMAGTVVDGRSNGATATRPPETGTPPDDGPAAAAPAAAAPDRGTPDAGTPAAAAAATGTPAKAPAARATRARKAPPGPAPASAADLPIREYDGLSASQVVSRLTGLTPDELRAVRGYEEASRGRRTILLAIDRLLG
ncbi:MAG TPA: hypothetical protein VGP90_12470 [Acidimicrobiia bacterium]|jgi:hypothetical protein|nr:hypothetical protein [Acidimicrobiia bacterium]